MNKRVKFVVNIILILAVVGIIVGGSVVSGLERAAERRKAEAYQQWLDDMVVWDDMPENTNENLKYFSFYSCDYDKEAFDEIVKFGCINVCWMSSEGYDMRPTFEKCRKFNYKIMVDWNNAIPGDSMYCPDLLAEYDDLILGFKYDEPWYNNKSEENFLYTTGYIRENYPDKMVYACLGITEFTDMGVLDSFLDDRNATKAPEGYYRNCTVLAFDYYCAWKLGGVESYLAELKKILLPGQKLWGVPKGFYATKGLNYFIENHDEPEGAELINNLRGYYELAVNDPLFIGLTVFSFRDGTFSDWGKAIENYCLPNSPDYQEKILRNYQQIGREIIKNADYETIVPENRI